MRFLSSFRRGLLGFCLLALIGGPLFAKEKWVTVSYPEFTVVSSLTPREAEAWAGEFAQYIAAMDDFFHVPNRKLLPPLTIVVFADEFAFKKFRPLDTKGKPREVAGFFQRHESWAIAGLGSVREMKDVRRTIFHEGVHWYLSGMERSSPTWMEEGLAEVFSTFRIWNNQVEWGRAIEDHPMILRQHSLMPLEKLLATSNADWVGSDTDYAGILYAESWLFVHYLTFGKHDIPANALAKYADLLFAGTMPDDAFLQAFGKPYKDVQRDLVHYLDGQSSFYIRKRPLANVPAVKAQPATPMDVEDALGRLSLAAGRYETAVNHAKAVITAASTDPRGYEVLGYALYEKGDEAGSLAAFDLAIEHGSKDYAPYFHKAISLQGVAKGALSVERQSLSVETARKAASLYEHAINLHPHYLLSYQNLAGIAGVMEPLSDDDAKFMELGHKLFPRDALIDVGRAILAHRSHHEKEAQELLGEVLARDTLAEKSTWSFAQSLAVQWEEEANIDQVNRLIEAEKFQEALALVDAWKKKGVSVDNRMEVENIRRHLAGNLKVKEIQAALQDARWVDARRLINELLASEAPPQIKNQVKKTLAELDQRKLGLEENER